MWSAPYVTYKVAPERIMDLRRHAEREQLIRISGGWKQVRLDSVVAGIWISFVLVVVIF